MSWDPKRLGFYCSRCDAQINMVFRQERFLGKYGEGKKNSDPYVSVSYCAFFEEDKKKYAYQGAYHYCWDCEKELSKLIQEFNSKSRSDGEGTQGAGRGNSDREVLLLDSDSRKSEKEDATGSVHAPNLPLKTTDGQPEEGKDRGPL